MYEDRNKRVAEASSGKIVQLLLGAEGHPVSVEEFLARIPSEIKYRIESVLVRFYKDPRKCDYPIWPQFLSAIVMRLRRMKWFTQIVRELKADDGKLGEFLGFKRRNGRHIAIPSEDNFRYFVKLRIGKEGIDSLILEVLNLLRESGERNGIKFGETVGQDPMVYESNDKEATYNGHYEKQMYKAQAMSCLDTQIPLFGDVKGGTEYAGNDTVPYLETLRAADLKPKVACLDGEYDTLENFALLNTKYRCESYIRMHTPELVPETEKHLKREIKKAYQKHWSCKGFLPDATTEQRVIFLVKKGELELPGRYYRRKYRNMAINNPKKFYGQYHRRSLEETQNSRLLDPAFLSSETTCNGTGLKNKNIHWKWCIFSVQLLALIRMYYGARKDFTSVRGIAL